MGKVRFLLVALVVIASPAGASAQALPDIDPGRSERTRADLEGLLEYYESVLQSSAYSAGVKEGIRANAQRVRVRLEEGDFRLGDRIALYVEGEPEMPDTVAVQAGPSISLPLFGDISLRGVLRSEIESHLTQELGRFIRDPVVRAKAMMRVSILGAVGAPGFYVVPADMLLGEALMAAGGPGSNANMAGLRIERGSTRLIEGQEIQDAMREGLTLDQLNLRAGDQITMPERGRGFFTTLGLVAGAVGSLSLIIFQLTR